jgi:hypothetical protein
VSNQLPVEPTQMVLPVTETPHSSPLSRYIRTTWMLSAGTSLVFDDRSRVRCFSTKEADELAEKVRKRNVFSRHSWENNFYIQRAKELADHTVIEVVLPGDPQAIAERAEKSARSIERLTVLSSILALGRARLQRKLGISQQSGTEINFVSDQQFRFLRSRSRPELKPAGIDIDNRFANRFFKCGFVRLAGYVLTKSDIAKRVAMSQEWLFDSRIEPRLSASVVKTAIALESLLIFNETESLAQTLSERVAFILSPDSPRRQIMSRTIRRFYDARSGVVHGSRKKAKKLTPRLVENVDRLVILLHLILAANASLWSTTDKLQEWCELERWGEPSSKVERPFPDIYLRNTIQASQHELEQKL